MKSKFFLIIFSIFFLKYAHAENISIVSKNISIDKDQEITVFEDDVIVKTKNKTIESDFVKYFRKKGLLIIKNNILVFDDKNNRIKTEYAEYSEKEDLLKTKGSTIIETSENYVLNGQDLIINNKEKIFKSEKKSILYDQEENKIILNNFEYSNEKHFFKSIGLVKIQDKNNNEYEFSQIYIDTKKKEILGTDSKAFLNSENFKINSKNNPRIFSNTVNLNKNKSTFDKSVFTLCGYRKNDSCPPWTIQSKKMLHDNVKKTIYYNNALIKVYNIPIFYFPILSHPDPSVERRSGFLSPTLYDSKNLGSGISVPYFFDLGLDKNFTFTNRFYVSENPLFLGQYHQAFKNSNLLTDFGYTEGYKKISEKKNKGQKSHFFTEFVKNFKSKNDFDSYLNITLQEVSNDKYLKLYKIKSNLVDYNLENLQKSINYSAEKDDLFFGLNASVYETLKSNYEDKYEYVLPEITLNKNLLLDENLGNIELQSNYKVHNYDTNKLTNFLVNDIDFFSNELVFDNGLNTKILANIKNINYESKNVEIYKNNPTVELYSSLGLMSEMNFLKNTDSSKHLLKPKMLIRYAPGSMRRDTSGSKLNPSNAFSMNKLSNINNYETGLSGTLGFNYKIKDKKDTEKFDFSIAQVVNKKENNKMADESSLNEKLSDLVGSTTLKLSKNFELNHSFSIDQNYEDFNYNEIGTTYNYGALKVDLNYLSENKHIGNQDYFKTDIELKNKDSGILSFNTKRNLITNSSEFYNLSYEYLNDCLRAGLVYRREFYNDSELEPEDSLMFKLTLVPFGSFNSPKLD
jgi:LPS-assembly protein